ncbi:MAG: sugar phosphate isomerase/epimerase family protein [Reyranellales bacterium]
MTLPRLALAVIGDEIGPSLDEMISFCAENDIRRLDMRTVDGRNLLGMTAAEVIAISRRLEKAGLSVPTFVSPVMKWAAPGKSPAGGKVDFAFDPATCPAGDPLDHAIRIAVILGARNMRIFGYLRHDGFRPSDLTGSGGELEKLLGFANHYDIALQLENEPVCNIGNVAELAAFFSVKDRDAEERAIANGELTEEEVEEAHTRAPGPVYLRPLIDIGNAWAMGERPSDADVAALAPLVTAIHLKDRDLTAGRTVPLGDGNVPWAAELKRLLGGVKTAEVLASIETHCPQDGRAATARSVAALRRIAGEIGVEIV